MQIKSWAIGAIGIHAGYVIPRWVIIHMLVALNRVMYQVDVKNLVKNWILMFI